MISGSVLCCSREEEDLPAYYYEGAYAGGERVTGVVEASSRNEAVALARQNCDMILSLREVKKSSGEEILLLQKVDVRALALVCRQFSIILKAGLPLVQAVDLTASQSQDRLLAKILRQAAEDVSNGWSLSYSLSQRGRKLPVTFIETVRSGEESGDLAGAFMRMSVYYDRMYKIRSKASGALMYPSFVIAVAAVVVGIIMLYAVPTFSSTFASMGIPLPAVTKFLIALSGFFTRYIVAIILVIAGALFLLHIYGRTAGGRIKMSRLKLALPVVGKIGRMAGASQFAHTMSTMLAAGMPILQAIEVSGRAMTNHAMSQAVLDTVRGVEAGQSLGECMSRSPDLPDMLIKMTAIGESTGSMEDTLEVMAEYYDNEVDTATARALSMLEPVIILMLAGIVVVILLAVYLPMFSMYSAI